MWISFWKGAGPLDVDGVIGSSWWRPQNTRCKPPIQVYDSKTSSEDFAAWFCPFTNETNCCRTHGKGAKCSILITKPNTKEGTTILPLSRGDRIGWVPALLLLLDGESFSLYSSLVSLVVSFCIRLQCAVTQPYFFFCVTPLPKRSKTLQGLLYFAVRYTTMPRKLPQMERRGRLQQKNHSRRPVQGSSTAPGQ